MTETPEELRASLGSEHARLPNRTLFQLALAGLKARLTRSMVTEMAVVLAIAYLSYSGVTNDVIRRMALSDSAEAHSALRMAGINVETTRAGDPLDRWLVVMALLTCAVGIANAMLMSVTERYREIGTMKCLGAEDGMVVKLFLIESALLGGVGSAAGVAAGVAISLIAGWAQFGGRPPYVFEYLSGKAVAEYGAFSFLAGVALCLIGAGYPALVAARMRPVEALRVEE